jgi:hypothetical protein
MGLSLALVYFIAIYVCMHVIPMMSMIYILSHNVYHICYSTMFMIYTLSHVLKRDVIP